MAEGPGGVQEGSDRSQRYSTGRVVQLSAGIAEHRLRLLRATLGFLRLEGQLPPVLLALHRWLDSWRGIGQLTIGMARQGFDLQLTRYAEQGWRATFYTSGREHSPTGAIGSAWEPMPWRAVQGAAWDALGEDGPGTSCEGRP